MLSFPITTLIYIVWVILLECMCSGNLKKFWDEFSAIAISSDVFLSQRQVVPKLLELGGGKFQIELVNILIHLEIISPFGKLVVNLPQRVWSSPITAQLVYQACMYKNSNKQKSV